LEQWLLERKTIDYENQLHIQEARKHWQDLLEILLNISQFLASHNLVFRGHRETLFSDATQNSRNVIDLIKLISAVGPLPLHK
jgi:hypothetical protein